MGSRLPIVIILGSTGVGKTKLSLELLQRFKGEIIGADSMQVYKGLDIITAKATKEEMSIAQHHLIDILNPTETFTVVEYRNRALQIIDNLFSKNQLPIVVGGTNYYVESLLWNILIEKPGCKTFKSANLFEQKSHEIASEELHKQLKLLDPNMAKRLHPNNKRKILRALEVLHQKGRKLSDILEEQQKSEGGSSSGGGLRFENAVVFWLQCEQNKLEERLNDRVDGMIEQGLVNELEEFYRSYLAGKMNLNENPDFTRGILQSIGFKEFRDYLVLEDSVKDSAEGKNVLNECISQLKIVTRRYAKKQTRWVINRFLRRPDRKVPPVFSLDTTDLTQWNKNVTLPAIEILESYMSNKTCTLEPLPLETVESYSNANDETFICKECDRIFIGKLQWNIHRKSNRHKKNVAKMFKNAGK